MIPFVVIGVLIFVGLLLAVATDFFDPAFGYKPTTRLRGSCSHWPRDPVINSGIEIAFICRKCDASIVNEAWVRGEL